jgi:hypothetical protein
MCTVTYLRLNNGFLLTSNRDERLTRPLALAPAKYLMDGVELIYPKDTLANGTWIAASENGMTVCLLNGGFEPHVPAPPYRMSRGLVVLDFFKSKSIEEFYNGYNLDGIEPFTLVVLEFGNLYELRWTGTQKLFKKMNELEPHIWSSVTLYTPQTIALREKWFAAFLDNNPHYTQDDILKFHLFAGEGDSATDIRMSRLGLVKTVSVTSVLYAGNEHTMQYIDLGMMDSSNHTINF